MTVLKLFCIFLKLGCTSFGGPVAHIGYFRNTFVSQRKWFTEQEYAHIVTLSQTLPGPASSQVGFAIGLTKAGLLGGFAAFIAFTLPSVLLLIVFATNADLLNTQVGMGVLKGLALLAFIVVSQAVLGMGRQMLTDALSWCIATIVFCVSLLVDYFYITLLSVLISAVIASLLMPRLSASSKPDEQENTKNKLIFSENNMYRNPYVSMFCAILFVMLFFLLPVLSPYIYQGASAFYTSGAMVFGGGHVVLPFLEQVTVATNMVSKDEFLAGYGATQAVPGPMFSFAAYLGFTIDSANIQSAIVGALLACFFVFLPGFLLITALLPVSQKYLIRPRVSYAFKGANASVVGVLGACLYDPIFTHAINNNYDMVIATLGFVLLVKYKAPVLFIIGLVVSMSVFFNLFI